MLVQLNGRGSFEMIEATNTNFVVVDGKKYTLKYDHNDQACVYIGVDKFFVTYF